MADSDNCTVINDQLTCHSLINSNRHTATELCLIPVGSRRHIEQDAPSDHLTPVEYAATLADCLDNGDYLIVIEDTSTSCQSSTMNVSSTQLASKLSKSADKDSQDYLVIIDDMSSNVIAPASNNHVTPVDSPQKLPNSAQSDSIVAAADATSQGYIDVVDDSKYYNSNTFIGEARIYTSLLDIHEQQQQEQGATVSDYDNTATFDVSDYDNNAIAINSEQQRELEVSVFDDVMYGQRRDSIYDQVDDTQVYELVDYTMSSNASVLAPSDQLRQQADYRSNITVYIVLVLAALITLVTGSVLFVTALSDKASSTEHNNDSSERPVVKQNITSVTYRNKITVGSFQSEAVTATLSVSRDGSRQLIVGQHDQKIIYICHGTNYSSVTTLLLPNANTGGLGDAVWTPYGHIVYTAIENAGRINKVGIMSMDGNLVVALTQITGAAQLSASANNVVYLADAKKGVYQSSDGGRTWSLMFNLTYELIDDSSSAIGWYIRQALEVSRDNTSVHLWTVEINNAVIRPRRLRLYKILLSNNTVTEIAETVDITAPIELIATHANSIEFDGLETVLLTCFRSEDVYLFNAVSGAYLRSVNVVSASANYVGIDNYPLRLAIDRHADGQVLLYVHHQNNDTVSIHTLAYE